MRLWGRPITLINMLLAVSVIVFSTKARWRFSAMIRRRFQKRRLQRQLPCQPMLSMPLLKPLRLSRLRLELEGRLTSYYLVIAISPNGFNGNSSKRESARSGKRTPHHGAGSQRTRSSAAFSISRSAAAAWSSLTRERI